MIEGLKDTAYRRIVSLFAIHFPLFQPPISRRQSVSKINAFGQN